ncbi:MAG: hypothetical protein R3F11_25890 [Verrucomicrobiales bacterium]
MSRNKKRYINAIGAPKLALRLLVAGLFCLAFVKLALLRNDRIEKETKSATSKEIASLRDEISDDAQARGDVRPRGHPPPPNRARAAGVVDIGAGGFFYITADAIPSHRAFRRLWNHADLRSNRGV